MIVEDGTEAEHEHTFGNIKRARKGQSQSSSAQEASHSEQAQPDLMPRMTSRVQHGNQILRDSMQEMAAITRASEQLQIADLQQCRTCKLSL